MDTTGDAMQTLVGPGRLDVKALPVRRSFCLIMFEVVISLQNAVDSNIIDADKR